MIDYAREITSLALCLCATDGMVSGSEEQALRELISQSFNSVHDHEIDNWIDQFFDSDLQIEDFALSIPDHDNRVLAIKIGLEASAVDGLDIRETLGLQKVLSLYGIRLSEVSDCG